MLASQRNPDNGRLRPLSELHRELLSVSEDARDFDRVSQSGRELTVALCALIENFCVMFLRLPDAEPSAATDAPAPKGSGVLVFSRSAPRDGRGILTTAHVLGKSRTGDRLLRVWVGSSLMMRSGDGRRRIGDAGTAGRISSR